MNVLLVAFYYPPDPAIGAVRVGALAQGLIQSGHCVHVLTSRGHVLPWKFSVSRLAWRDPGSALRWFPDEIVAKTSGTRNQSSKSSGPCTPSRIASPTPLHDSLKRKFHKLAKNFIERPARSFTGIRPAARRGREIVRSKSIDAIVASRPPFTTLVIAAQLADEFSIQWSAGYRDLWTRGLYYQFDAMRRRLDRRLERRTRPVCSTHYYGLLSTL